MLLFLIFVLYSNMGREIMKKLIFLYRIVSVILIIFLCFMYTQYANEECTEEKVINITNPNYVFLGDSITDFYDLKKYYGEDLPIVNSGINGNIVEHILDNLDTRVYQYNPSKVILLIGINNYIVCDDSVNTVVEGIGEIVKQIKEKLPNCEIYVESIYPMNNDHQKFISTEKIKETNNEIEKICNKYDVKYIDIFSKLIDNETNQLNKKYSDDGLHMNEEGYKIITEIVKKSIF